MQPGAAIARRLATLCLLDALLGWGSAAQAGPISTNDWLEFSFADVGTSAVGCDPADPAGAFCIGSSGTPTGLLDAPPWTFTAGAGGALLTVVDAFLSGDRFEVFDFATNLGLTSVSIDGTTPPVPWPPPGRA